MAPLDDARRDTVARRWAATRNGRGPNGNGRGIHRGFQGYSKGLNPENRGDHGDHGDHGDYGGHDGTNGNGKGSGSNWGMHYSDESGGGAEAGGRGGGYGIGNGIITTLVATATTTRIPSIPSIRTVDSGIDSNGAQQLSSDAVGITWTATPTKSSAVVATTLHPVILTPSSVVTAPLHTIVTEFIPFVTTSVVATPTAAFDSLGIASTRASSSNLSGLPKPTSNGGADDDSYGRRHKGTTSNSTDSDGNSNHRDRSRGKKHASSLSPTAERALISLGSIGAFVTVCFLVWLVWRVFRRHKKHKGRLQGSVSTFDTSDSDKPSAAIYRIPARAYQRIASKVPFLRRKRRAWSSFDETSSVAKESKIAPMARPAGSLPPQMTARAAMPSSWESRSISRDTIRSFIFKNSTRSTSPPPAMPSDVDYATGLGIQSPPSRSRSPSPSPLHGATEKTALGESSFYLHSPSGSVSSVTLPVPSTEVQQAAILPSSTSSSSSVVIGQATIQPMAMASGLQQQQVSVPQRQTLQQPTLGDESVTSGTMRSHMPDPFYNQSQLARLPSDAYDPARRQVNRASELSSLSSGFGDGDMLVIMPTHPNTSTDNTGALPSSIPIPAQPMSSKGQFSWMRDPKRMTRETVYSELSDDTPGFRTVESWVKQQTGRVRRGQASIDATADASAGGLPGGGIRMMPGTEPGIPHPLPEEQRLTMMMDDGEVPRRPDTVLIRSLKPQGPEVPA